MRPFKATLVGAIAAGAVAAGAAWMLWAQPRVEDGNLPPPLGVPVKEFRQFEPFIVAQRRAGEAAPVSHESPKYESIRDIAYGPHGYRNQLNLHLPAGAARPMPVVVWVHGGGWCEGSKDNDDGFPAPLLEPILRRGIAVACINYRPAWLDDRLPNPHHDQPVPFPAAVQDCKAAIRFLRAKAGEYGLDPDAIGISGHSSGGHLSALVGTSNGVALFDSDGERRDISSDVQASAPIAAATNFRTYFEQLRLHLRAMNVPAADFLKDASRESEDVNRFLGGRVSDRPDIASAASPITYAGAGDPPFLIVHGFRDGIVAPHQAEYLYTLLRRHDVDAQLLMIPGAGHAGEEIFNLQVGEALASFFHQKLARAVSSSGAIRLDR